MGATTIISQGVSSFLGEGQRKFEYKFSFTLFLRLILLIASEYACQLSVVNTESNESGINYFMELSPS
jgi:hypothetical protein